MKDKEQEKMRDLLALAKDQETQKMIDMMAYNWEVCASRMEQITKERQQGLFDDNGVEATAVFNRMERVGTLMTALKDRPQALLLKGFREQFEPEYRRLWLLQNRPGGLEESLDWQFCR